jgi:hypothetical protein
MLEQNRKLSEKKFKKIIWKLINQIFKNHPEKYQRNHKNPYKI